MPTMGKTGPVDLPIYIVGQTKAHRHQMSCLLETWAVGHCRSSSHASHEPRVSTCFDHANQAVEADDAAAVPSQQNMLWSYPSYPKFKTGRAILCRVKLNMLNCYCHCKMENLHAASCVLNLSQKPWHNLFKCLF